jgi:hypothetical protein
LERLDRTKDYLVAYHVRTSVLGVVDVQYPTPECDRVHRHHSLLSDFLDLWLEPPTPGGTKGIFARVGVDLVLGCS